MKLSKDVRANLVHELRFASQSMKSAPQFQDKLYFFSATYGAANRLMNMEYDPELAFVHHVLFAAYSTMMASLTAVRAGQLMVTFDPGLVSKLEQQVDLLADLIEADKSTHDVLQKIANIAYGTTGNGHYLLLKGALIP